MIGNFGVEKIARNDKAKKKAKFEDKQDNRDERRQARAAKRTWQ